jgi:hypothetical protein
MKRSAAFMFLFALTILTSTGCNLLHRGCNSCNATTGCRPCSMGWQRGGTDYQRYLSQSSRHTGGNPSGVQGPTTANPYYTTRGPRDFLVDNPPTIGR